MKPMDFVLYDKTTCPTGQPVVLLQAGKGKNNDEMRCVLASEFTFVEGIIWNRHREYGMSRKSKINTIDWTRIIAGFQEAMTDAEKCESKEQLIDILSVSNHVDTETLENVFTNKTQLIRFIDELIQWLTTHTANVKYILINKNI